MKTKYIILVISLIIAGKLYSQNYAVFDTLRNNPSLLGGMESAYQYREYPQTTVPKGFHPFYIGHYGRHGSRYGWNSKMYTLILNTFQLAKEQNALTEKGRTFWELYKDFYQIPLMNTGDLTDLGWQQHYAIANMLYNQYQEVFKKNAKIKAISSTGGRAILSMGSFLCALKENNPKLKITANSLHSNAPYTMTKYAPTPILKHYKADSRYADLESPDSFSHRIINYESILSIFFNNFDFFKQNKISRTELLSQLLDFIFNYKNYESKPIFDRFIDVETLLPLWEYQNYSIYCIHNKELWNHIPLLHHFIDKAEDAIAGIGNAADLRFGHDHVLNPFTALLNLNDEQHKINKAEDVKYWFQNYNTPMASFIAFILYRNSKGEILFKIIKNGKESHLPQLKPIDGPYYRWSDFTTWANQIFLEHPAID